MRNDVGAPREFASDGSEGAERIAFSDGALATEHDHCSGAFGTNFRGAYAAQRVNRSDTTAFADTLGQVCLGNKESVERCGMVHLKMRLLSVSSDASFLLGRGKAFAGQTSQRAEQSHQTAIQHLQISRIDPASSAAFHVDSRNITRMSRAQRSSGKKGSAPAPERLEARRHAPLDTTHGVRTGQVAYPRQQFIRGASTVQIDIMGGLSQQLGVKKVGQSLADRALWASREGTGKISAIARVTTLSCKESRFIKNRDQNHSPVQRVRAPAFGPRAQNRRSFVFIAVRASIDQDDRSGRSHPDPRIETHIASGEAATMKPRGECFQIKTRFRHRNSHG